MSKYERLEEDLELHGEGSMKCFGNDFDPILPYISINFYKKKEEYTPGDIVFCQVKRKYYWAAYVGEFNEELGRFLITDVKGDKIGFTKRIFGKLIKSLDRNNVETIFS